MLAIENHTTTVTHSGNNATVIRTIKEVFDEYKDTVRPITVDLDGLDLYSQCYSIFQYIIDHVQYKEDEGNNQYIKTPARLLNDGVGDCKSMAILAACCLYTLGIPCYLRFVSFNKNPIYTHTYVVVPDGDSEIVIDPVERVNGKPQFDYARQYKLKKDIQC